VTGEPLVTGSDEPVVALVHLGRTGSMGGMVRNQGLTDIFGHAGARVVDVPLMIDHRAGPAELLHPGLGPVLSGRAVPESLAWDHRAVLRRLRQIEPTVVVCSTSRSYHPSLLDGPWTLVLDYVDRLSDSYRDRAAILGGSARSVGYRALSALARRFEAHPPPPGVVGIAAGWTDARALGLDWVPITLPLAVRPVDIAPTHDLLFFGKLSYEPNVEAIEHLAALWPALERRRPGTTVLLAGARPEARVLDLARRLGWTVEPDFDDLGVIMARARLAVVPLVHASGIQTKVLDAARFGLPQVVSPIAASGLAPGFPALVAGTDAEFVEAVAELLDDPARSDELGHRARAHFADTYTPERWTGWADRVLHDALIHGSS